MAVGCQRRGAKSSGFAVGPVRENPLFLATKPRSGTACGRSHEEENRRPGVFLARGPFACRAGRKIAAIRARTRFRGHFGAFFLHGWDFRGVCCRKSGSVGSSFLESRDCWVVRCRRGGGPAADGLGGSTANGLVVDSPAADGPATVPATKRARSRVAAGPVTCSARGWSARAPMRRASPPPHRPRPRPHPHPLIARGCSRTPRPRCCATR